MLVKTPPPPRTLRGGRDHRVSFLENRLLDLFVCRMLKWKGRVGMQLCMSDHGAGLLCEYFSHCTYTILQGTHLLLF